MSEAHETKPQPLAAAETAGDSDGDQQPSLKTGLTENLEDMGIDSSEDTSQPEPMEIDDDDTGPAPDNQLHDDVSKPEDVSQDHSQGDPESEREEKASSGETAESNEKTQGLADGNSQKPTFIEPPDEGGDDEPVQQLPSGQDVDTEGKNSDDVGSGQEKLSEQYNKDGVQTSTETSQSVKDKPINEPENNKTAELKEKTSMRRSRSQEDQEEHDQEEKGTVDEDQNESGAKKPRKDKDRDAGEEQRPQRTLRPRRPDLSLMHTLKDFGYAFNENDELRQINTGSRYVFEVVPGDQSFNQRHYETLGEIITEHVFKLMETRCHLQKVYVPVDATEQDPRTFIFVSENILPVIHSEQPISTDKKLMVFIHGSGVVRAGQWARRLIINNSLNEGTMIPYIDRAKKEGYEVMLLNTNIHSDNGRTIKGSSNSEAHGRYVWKHFISKWPNKVAIIAHSAGGYVTVEMAKQCLGFMDKVFAVGFTDSVHSLGYYTSRDVSEWVKEHCKNWVSSSKPLDTKLGSYGGDCPRVSAGTVRHEETSYYSMESIFTFFEEKIASPSNSDEDVDENMSAGEEPRSPEIPRGETGTGGTEEEKEDSEKVQTHNVQNLGAKGNDDMSAQELGRTEKGSGSDNSRNSSHDVNGSKRDEETEENQERAKEEL